MRSKRLSDIELDTINARIMKNNPQPIRDMEDKEVQDNNNDNEIQDIQDIPRENITPAQKPLKHAQMRKF